MFIHRGKVFKAALMLLLVCSLSSISYSVASDVVNSYNIGSSEYVTTVSDTDGDNVYDTYSMSVNGLITTTYSICDIGDLSKWPPTGVPTVTLMSNLDGTSFQEVYTGASGSKCMFVKTLNSNVVTFVDVSASSN
ncbi:MAG: hypothetical protein PF588_04545 [Candidatus Kapabacteria bacterium]|jgi:hypothetical protein|nr:hypothetical protein [Candidatus Kapabacteria bacterium]